MFMKSTPISMCREISEGGCKQVSELSQFRSGHFLPYSSRVKLPRVGYLWLQICHTYGCRPVINSSPHQALGRICVTRRRVVGWMCQRPQSTNKEKTPSEDFIYCKRLLDAYEVFFFQPLPVLLGDLCFGDFLQGDIFPVHKVSLSTLHSYLKHCYSGSKCFNLIQLQIVVVLPWQWCSPIANFGSA